MPVKKAVRRRKAVRRKPAAHRVVHHRSPAHKAASPRRRRAGSYSRKSKTLLSEAFNTASMKQTGSALLSGGVGFFLVYQLLKTMQTAPAIQRMALGGAVSFITGAFFGMPNLAAGMGGAVVLDVINTQQNKMSENTNYLSNSELNQLPMVLSEDFLAAGEDYLAAPYMSAPYMSFAEDVDYDDV